MISILINRHYLGIKKTSHITHNDDEKTNQNK